MHGWQDVQTTPWDFLFAGHAEPARAIQGGGMEDMKLQSMKSILKLTELSVGQRTQDQTHLLQGQGVPEAHPAQSHTIQGWKGTMS